jgi:hypothetical protein
MIEIFGEELTPRMTVGELRLAHLERDDLAVPPSTVALVRGFWGHRWMAEHDPVLTNVLMDRLSRRVGGYSPCCLIFQRSTRPKRSRNSYKKCGNPMTNRFLPTVLAKQPDRHVPVEARAIGSLLPSRAA